jgi:hypothetical protein
MDWYTFAEHVQAKEFQNALIDDILAITEEYMEDRGLLFTEKAEEIFDGKATDFPLRRIIVDGILSSAHVEDFLEQFSQHVNQEFVKALLKQGIMFSRIHAICQLPWH